MFYKKLGYNYNYVLIQKKDSNIWKIGLNFYNTLGTTQHSSLPSWLWWHNHKDHFARNILRLHQSPLRALTAYAFWHRSVYIVLCHVPLQYRIPLMQGVVMMNGLIMKNSLPASLRHDGTKITDARQHNQRALYIWEKEREREDLKGKERPERKKVNLNKIKL